MFWNLHVVIVNLVLLSVMECYVMMTSSEVLHVHYPAASQRRMRADMWTASQDSLDVIPNVIDRQSAHNQGAIERLGMGCLNKIALRFEEAWWPKARHGLAKHSPPFVGGAFVLSLMPFLKEPVLVGFTTGRPGLEAESLSDEETVERFLEGLRACFDVSIPDPVATRVTRWGSDPFAQGSYSHIPLGASGEDRDALGRDVEGRLWFAGEAVSRDNPATVHGAYMTGRKAAKRIRKSL